MYSPYLYRYLVFIQIYCFSSIISFLRYLFNINKKINKSNAYVLLKLLKFIVQQSQVTVYLLRPCHHRIYLIRKPTVLRLLSNQVILSKYYQISYILSSNIFTSIKSFVFDYSVVCFASFSMPWNSVVRFLRVRHSSLICLVSFEVWALVRGCGYLDLAEVAEEGRLFLDLDTFSGRRHFVKLINIEYLYE